MKYPNEIYLKKRPCGICKVEKALGVLEGRVVLAEDGLCFCCRRSFTDRLREVAMPGNVELVAQSERGVVLEEMSDIPVAATEMIRVGVCIDTPNITRRVSSKYGPGVRPAWRELLAKAGILGRVTSASAVVNSGLPGHVTAQFVRAGYCVTRATGVDCDEVVVSAFVSAAMLCDAILLVGGDHIYADAVKLARQAGRRVIVVAVAGSCSRNLTEAAAEVWEMPIVSYAA